MNWLSMSAMASILIVVVIIIRAAAINKLPKVTFLILWGIVLARLLFPVSFTSSWSIYNLMGSTEQQITAGSNLAQESFVWNTVTELTQTMTNTSPSAPGGETVLPSTDTAWTFPPLHIWIWVLVALGLASFFVITHLRWLREYKTALPINDPYISEWLARRPLWRTVRIRQSDQISSPMTYGIFRPVILLPKAMDYSDRESLNCVLTHEFIHIRRWDTLSKWVLTAALCIHWFNPLVWIMYRLASRDLELSCDEKVVQKMGFHQKSAYALTLLDMEEKKSRLTPMFSNFSKNRIEERIEAIMKLKKTNLVSISLAAALVTGTTLAFATSAVDNTSLGKYEQAIGDAKSSYAEHINENTGELAFIQADQYQLSIDSTLFTDNNVYAILSLDGAADGTADGQPEAKGRIVYPNVDQTLYSLTGELTELETVDDIRYFLYSSMIAEPASPVAANEELILAAGDNFLRSNSLRDHEGKLLELTVSLRGEEHSLITLVQNVSSEAFIVYPDAKHYDGDYFDKLILTPWELKMSGTSSEKLESALDLPHIDVTIQFKDRSKIHFSFDTRGTTYDEGYPVGMSRGTGDDLHMYHYWNFRNWEIDLNEVKAVHVNGVRYSVSR